MRKEGQRSALAVSIQELEKESYKYFPGRLWKGEYCEGLWQKRIGNNFFIDIFLYKWPTGTETVEAEGYFYFSSNTIRLTILNPSSIQAAQEVMEKFFSSFNCESLDD